MVDLISDMWGFMKAHKKLWLLPIMAILLALGAMVVLTQGSAAAPFIYSIF